MSATDMLKAALEHEGYVVLPPSFKPLLEELERNNIHCAKDLQGKLDAARHAVDARIKEFSARQTSAVEGQEFIINSRTEIPGGWYRLSPEPCPRKTLINHISHELTNFLEKNYGNVVEEFKEKNYASGTMLYKARFRFLIPPKPLTYDMLEGIKNEMMKALALTPKDLNNGKYDIT
jgi:hypothetical protein